MSNIFWLILQLAKVEKKKKFGIAEPSVVSTVCTKCKSRTHQEICPLGKCTCLAVQVDYVKATP